MKNITKQLIEDLKSKFTKMILLEEQKRKLYGEMLHSLSYELFKKENPTVDKCFRLIYTNKGDLFDNFAYSKNKDDLATLKNNAKSYTLEQIKIKR